MSLKSRLKQLERGPYRMPDDGSCRGCWHRKKNQLTVHDDEPLPEPCRLCGLIPEAVVYIYTSTDGSEIVVPRVLNKARWLAVFPDDGRGS
jgi:hypothetical protein